MSYDNDVHIRLRHDLSKFVGISQDIEILKYKKKNYTIEHKKLCNDVIFNFELYHTKNIYYYFILF